MPGQNHKATYARDKRLGGYLIRVEGPHANRFTGRDVPVTRRNGTESTETLEDLIWSGVDDESGKPVALYHFAQQAKEPDEVAF